MEEAIEQAKPENKSTARSRRWRETHREAVRARTQAWRDKNQESIREANRKYHYGLEPGEYDRMFAAQGGVCARCGGPETSLGRSGKLKPLSVDHCYKTLLIRSLLCFDCNKRLGFLEKDLERLRGDILYLMAHGSPAIDALRLALAPRFALNPFV